MPRSRLKEALANADDDRVRQETVLFANKIDVDEELTRLTTHIAELRRILDKGGAVGKRLDFLMQELNREANTLGSKAADIREYLPNMVRDFQRELKSGDSTRRPAGGAKGLMSNRRRCLWKNPPSAES